MYCAPKVEHDDIPVDVPIRALGSAQPVSRCHRGHTYVSILQPVQQTSVPYVGTDSIISEMVIDVLRSKNPGAFLTLEVPETIVRVVRRPPADPRRVLYLAGRVEQRRDNRCVLVRH